MNQKQWDVELFEYYQSQLQEYQNEIDTFVKQLYHHNNTIQKQKKQIELLTNKVGPNLCVICLISTDCYSRCNFNNFNLIFSFNRLIKFIAHTDIFKRFLILDCVFRCS